MATIAQSAAHLFMDERTFKEHLDSGTITRQPRAAYDLDEVREEYIRHIRDVASGRSIKGDLDPGQERARKDKELADHTALKNAVMRKELLPREDVHVAVTSAFARVRAKLLALPTKLAPLVLGLGAISVIREKISDGINEALAELASTIIAGIPADDGGTDYTGSGSGLVGDICAASEPDSEPVGGSRKKAEPRGKR